MNGELIIRDLFNDDHVTLLNRLFFPHKISWLIHLLPRHVITPDKCGLARGHHRLGRYALEVIPRSLAFLASCRCHELWGFNGGLWLALCQALQARFLMLLDYLVEDLMVGVLLLVTMEVGARGVLVQVDHFLLLGFVHGGVTLRDLLLLLRIHVVEVYCWGTADVLDMHWSMQVRRLTLVIVDSCSIIALLHMWVVLMTGSV